jgi:hypothetical protein
MKTKTQSEAVRFVDSDPYFEKNHRIRRFLILYKSLVTYISVFLGNYLGLSHSLSIPGNTSSSRSI